MALRLKGGLTVIYDSPLIEMLTLALSRAWKRERSGRWKASAAVLGSVKVDQALAVILS
jgi:hypothetical protein